MWGAQDVAVRAPQDRRQYLAPPPARKLQHTEAVSLGYEQGKAPNGVASNHQLNSLNRFKASKPTAFAPLGAFERHCLVGKYSKQW